MVKKVNSVSLKEISDNENAKAEAERNKAKIEYVAMMSGIDFPDDNEEEENE